MNIQFIEVVIKGMTPHHAAVIDSLEDVPELFRADAAPSWAGTYKVKRHIFNWLNKLRKVEFYMQQVEKGVFHYIVKPLFMKEWSFYLTPEQIYMVANIVYRTQKEGMAQDVLFNFRGRKFFLPFELHVRFINSLHAAAAMHPERVFHIQEEMRRNPEQEEEEKPLADPSEPEVKRVLH